MNAVAKKFLNKYWKSVYIPTLLFLITLIAYVHNLSPSVYGGDSGDLIAAALTKGVPHPSGYPIQTMLGILFLQLPVAASPAWKVGLVSAVFSALTVVVVYFTALELSKRKVLATLASLSLAFTYSFWLYAEVAEVFALNSFFISILVFLTIRFIQGKEKRILYLVALITGLSLANNQSILIILPFVALTLFLVNWKIIFDIKTVLFGVVLFFLGLTPYLYIPIVARNYPFMNWGYAVNLENFWYLITRQYYGWGEGVVTIQERFAPENITLRLDAYLTYWKSYVHPLVPILVLLGYLEILKRKKFLTFFLLGAILLFVGPIFIIYAGTDFKSFLGLATVERFLISNLLITFPLIPLGVVFLENLIQKLPVRKFTGKLLNSSIVAVLFLIPIISFYVNFERVDLSDVFIGDNVAKDILANVPEDSVLMLRNDSLAFNTIYYQQAHDFREDVSIPGPPNGFEANLRAIGLNDEEIHKHILTSKGEIDKNIFDRSILGMLEDGKNVYIDGVYTVYENDEEKKIVAVPHGLVYKFELQKNLPYPKEDYVNKVKDITGSYHASDFKKHEDKLLHNLMLADIQKLYSADYYRISEYLFKQYQDIQLSAEFLIKSTGLDPFTLFADNNQ